MDRGVQIWLGLRRRASPRVRRGRASMESEASGFVTAWVSEHIRASSISETLQVQRASNPGLSVTREINDAVA
eukprot:1202484-Pleurochrysis_carterae.AAC.1